MESGGSAATEMGRKNDRSQETGAAVRAEWKGAKEKGGRTGVMQAGFNGRTGESRKQQQAQGRGSDGGQDACE